jgi:hypothetical protein
MSKPNQNELQSIGRQLAQFVRQSGGRASESGVLQGVIADLAAGQLELFAPLRDLVGRQSFQALLPHALSGGGTIQRDALIQEISGVYHPDMLVSIEQVLNGFLGSSGGVAVSLNRSEFPSRTSSETLLDEKQSTDHAQPSTTQSASSLEVSSVSPTGQPSAIASTNLTPSNGAVQRRGQNVANLSPLFHAGLLGVGMVVLIGVIALVNDNIRRYNGKSCEQIAEELAPLSVDDPKFRPLIESNKSKCSDNSQFLVQEAILADDDNRKQEALNLIAKAIRLNPSDGDAFFWQGDFYHGVMDYRKALNSYERSIELDPSSEAHFRKGVVMSHLDLPLSEVEAAYSRAIAIDSRPSYFFRERARVRLDLKKYQASLADAEQAIKLDPNDADSYQVRAYAKTWLDDFQGACADIKLAKQKGLKTIVENSRREIPIDKKITEICS